MKVYLDNCCYDRPFDDQSQLRVRLETEAKLEVQTLMRRDYTKWRERNMYLDGDLHSLAERARLTGARFEAARQQRKGAAAV